MKYLWCLLTFLGCLAMAWIGGFNFDSRGPIALFVAYITIVLTIVVGIAVSVFPKKD